MTLIHHVFRRRSLVAVALLLLWPSIAMSAGPEKTAFSATFSTYLVAPNPDGSLYILTCSGDPVIQDIVQYGTITTWRDENGYILQLKVHAKDDREIYLESGQGRRLLSRANYNVFTLTPGAGWFEDVEKWTGLFWHVVVPGVGTVLLDGGLEIIDFKRENPVVRAVGNHQWLEGDFDKLCAALQ